MLPNAKTPSLAPHSLLRRCYRGLLARNKSTTLANAQWRGLYAFLAGWALPSRLIPEISMPEERVSFSSKGLKLTGVIRVPDGLKPGERRPAFIILHGFGSRMTADNVMRPTAMFEKLGYVCMRFDMPGCGESEGE